MEELDKLLLEKPYINLDIEYDVYKETLYHYTSPEGLLSILRISSESNPMPTLWFTRYDSLNDKKERQHILDYLQNYCMGKLRNKVFSHEFVERISKIQLSDNVMVCRPGDECSIDHEKRKPFAVADIEECDTYLCCFSSEPDLLPMWNYYTKSQHYEGYSIGIWSTILNASQDMLDGYRLHIKRVIYDPKEKNEKLDELLIPLAEIFDKGDEEIKARVIKNISYILSTLQFVFKHEGFAHEKEIRAILQIPKDQTNARRKFTIKYRNSNGYIVPYVEFAFSKEAITAVTVAPLLQADLAKKNLEEMLLSKGYTGAYVSTSELPIRF